MHMSLQSRGWPSSSLLKDSGADTEKFRGREGSASRTELSELAAHWLAAHAPPALASLQPWDAGTS